MKKVSLAIAATLVVAWFTYSLFEKKDSRQDYERFLQTHAFKQQLVKGEPEGEGENKPDRPDLAFMQDYLRTMDPKMKRPVPEILTDFNIKTARFRDQKDRSSAGRSNASMLADLTQWEERGPSMVGGRTRAMLFDAADPEKKKVWAGGVSGGLWYNNDITDELSSWNKVDDFWDNISISCIADDPNNDQIMYVGTGESHNQMRGGGIWKTTDGGATWNRLTSTTDFLLVRDIEVRNEGGTSAVYAAVHNDYGLDDPADNAGLYRSANGGSTWTQVLPLIEFDQPHTPTDIEIGDNEIWVGAKPTYSNSSNGSIIYKSTTGTGNWSAFGLATTGQVELGVSSSEPDVVYAILEDGGAVSEIIKTADNGGIWETVNKPVDNFDTSIPADDFTRGQAWYDLTIAINPNNAGDIIVGGIDLFRTTDGGFSWTQISKWDDGLPGSVPAVHADQHEILYRPGFDNQVIFGNDGGVYYSANIKAATSSLSIEPRNSNYNVTQFYSAALHPALPNYMLGGTQDNGTQKFTLSGFGITSVAQGGDGAMCFIDQLDPSLQIVSYIYNDISYSTDGGLSFQQLLLDYNSGNFINVGDYDSHRKVLYTAKNASGVYRIKQVTSNPITGTLSIPALGSIATALRVSPHATNVSNLYVGTEAGRLFKILNAESNSPNIIEITGNSFPNGAISSIAFGESEDQILVTFFNYGVVNIWETRNGGDTWQNKEGNLPNMPVRWAEYHPHDPNKIFIATELGVWSTDDVTVANPEWNSTNGGLANVRTDMLRIRKSDGVMLAATHGRGFFTALIPSQLPQDIAFDALPEKTFGDQPFTISATASSTLPITFSSSDPAIASVDENTITIFKAGAVTITAAQGGNNYYAPASPVSQTLIINKSPQSISFEEVEEKTINDVPFDLSATATSNLAVIFTSSNANVATVSGNRVTIEGTGTTTLTASQAGNSNFLGAANVQRTLTVVSRIINLTGDLNFGEVNIGETASSDLTITNTGTASLDVTDIIVPDGYTFTSSVVGTAIIVEIEFAPTDDIEYNGEVEVQSNATSGANTIAITGTGVRVTAAETNEEKLLTVYPNPASEWLLITGGNFKNVTTLNLTDETGRCYDQVVESSETQIRMNVSTLRQGVYIIAVPLNGKVYFKKFTKSARK